MRYGVTICSSSPSTHSSHGRRMLSRSLSARCCHASLSLAVRYRAYTTEPLSRPLPVIKSQHNQGIVDLLVRSLQEEESKASANPFKIQAFSKAIDSIRTLDRPIRSGNDVHAVQGIGPGITARINDHLLQLYTAEADRDMEIYKEIVKSRCITMFNDIPSIGLKKATDLADAGCLSVDNLVSGRFNSMLSAKQILNVKYAHHLEQPTTRQQAEDVLAFCRHHFDPAFQFDLVGEYRRGITSLTDIQIMVSHPSFVHIPLPPDPSMAISSKKETKPKAKTKRKKRDDEGPPTNVLYSEIIPMLHQTGFISDTLTFDATSWTGFARLPGRDDQWGTVFERLNAIKNTGGDFRRVSLNIAPQRSLGSAQLWLTGNAKFEKYLCYRAQRRGLMLNAHGLWRWTASRGSAPPDGDVAGAGGDDGAPHDGGHWVLLRCATEEDIFRELGMAFVDPERRSLSAAFRVPKVEYEVDEV
ncbi:hypothetical protein HYPSUDRAFT_140979 [Hypholoma sublateritium FD-334 SS-4]|uniref:DNA polymerase n=1 Tax=Hypholoma sublateritium (strain FD-334 SS-4) TaxID=945553 RepID=A0A0D2MCN5_HYPSF|nr:hypothetical protein HYPSUDRAFT_140979 [Hypholoma sublateritium FD-334 SS-4]